MRERFVAARHGSKICNAGLATDSTEDAGDLAGEQQHDKVAHSLID
jgi:hypothetical protein